MKAIIQHRYGTPDDLSLEEVDKPVPQDDEVLVRVFAASINGSDWEGLRGKPLYARLGGLFRPGNKLLGSDIAGQVERVGKNVSLYQPGDEVFGEVLSYRGGFAEYACTAETALSLKPTGMTYQEAAAIPQAAMIALQGIRDKGQVRPGQHVLINGAGGGAGTFAVQLAKLYGAEVTAVDNAHKQDFLRSLGADHVIDYRLEDYTRGGKQYDLILDIAGYRSAFAIQRALKPSGSYYVVGGSVGTLLQVLLLGAWYRRSTGKNLRVLAVDRHHKYLDAILELVAAGKIAPMIDRHYPLNEVPEALRYVGEGRAKGKIIITMAPGS
jgi:NADPH:quinone reductase-like Zn-dependent oxidoreductase